MARSPASSWPLRLVVGSMPHPDYPCEPTLIREVYECGHTRLPKQDAFGQTFATKRRCAACAAGRAADMAPDELKRLLSQSN